MNKPRRRENPKGRRFRLEEIYDNCGCGVSYYISHSEQDYYPADVEFTNYNRVWNISVYAIMPDGNSLKDRQIGGDWTKRRPSEDRIIKVVKSEVSKWHQEQLGI